MKQEKFDDYVAKMDSILEELKNDFSEQLKTNGKVHTIEYKIIVSPVDISLSRITERNKYFVDTYTPEYVEEKKVAKLAHFDILEEE